LFAKRFSRSADSAFTEDSEILGMALEAGVEGDFDEGFVL
jgi:hypothetical protein